VYYAGISDVEAGTYVYLVYMLGGLSPLTNVTAMKESSLGSRNENLQYSWRWIAHAFNQVH